MKAALEIDLTFDQILALVKQLPRQEKIRLTKELEKEAIETKLEGLLKTFQNDALNLDTINEEVEIARLQLYDSQKD